MEIMLHLGAHRSASTSFQTYLWNNRDRLAKRGLTTWIPKRTRDGLLAGLFRNPAKISVEDERKAIRSVGRVRLEIERLRRAGQDGLLISEENMLGSMRNNVVQTRLYPLAGERLMRFQPMFADRKLRIALCIRSYEDYWASCMASLIGRGGDVPCVDTLDFLTTQPRRWRHVIRDIATCYPDAQITVWPFERMAGRADVQLGALWGGELGDLGSHDIWRCRSANLVRLNDMMALRGERAIVDGTLTADARWMPFDEDQRSVLRAEYRRDLAWLTAGAEGLATYFDGPLAPIEHSGDVRTTYAPTTTTPKNSGQIMPASQPDRAEVTTPRVDIAALLGGRHDGIKERLDRTGAS